MGPAQLLLERVVLVVVFVAAATAVVALTVTDHGAVVALLDIAAEVEVAVEGEGEVFQEVELDRRDGVHRVAGALVLVELVLPDDVAVHVLVTGIDLNTVLVVIVTRVILLFAVRVKDVFTRVDVVEVHRIDRRDVTAVHERVHIGVGTRGSIEVALVRGVDVEAQFHVRGGFHVDGGTTGEAVEAGGPQVTVLIQITQGEVVVCLVGGTGCGSVVFLAETGLDGLTEPVKVVLITLEDGGIGSQLAILEEGVRRFVPDVEFEAVADQVRVRISGSIGSRVAIIVLTVVLEGHPVDIHKLTGVSQVVFRNTSLVHTGRSAERDVQASRLAFLGGDQDHTVGSAVTVQGCGSGVLQDGHGLDISRVQVRQVTTVGYAVDDIHRAGATIHGTVTTDHDGRVGTRVTEGAVDLHAGHRTFQGRCDRRDRTGLDLVGVDVRNSTRQGRFLRGTVGDGDHRLFQVLGVRGQDHVDDTAAVNGDFLVQVADGAENQRRFLGNIDGVVTVSIRGRSGHGAFHLDRGKRDSFAGGVGYRTFDRNVLRKGGSQC